jgi:PEGA domain
MLAKGIHVRLFLVICPLVSCIAISHGQQIGKQRTAEEVAKMVKEGTGSLTFISSTPSGADILLDGKLFLHTPARFLMEKRSAARTLMVTMAGYKPYEQKVDVNGQPVILSVKLEKLQSAAPSTATVLGLPGAVPGGANEPAPPPIELKAPPEGVAPYDIKGVKLGALLTEWQQQNPNDCTRKLVPALLGAQNLNGPLSCLNTWAEQQTTYAGVPVESMQVSFYGQRLVSVSFSFGADAYETLRDALQEKFGKFASAATETYQNAFGATYSGAVVTWRNNVSTLVLSEISNDREHCGLNFWHNDLALAKERGARPKANAKDM